MKICPDCGSTFEDRLAACPQDGVALNVLDSDPWLGQTLSDRYVIESLLGRGGMGLVYRARHTRIDRDVAIKMLHAHLVTDSDAIKRFHQEAQAVSRVNHPNTVTLFDFGITDSGQPYIVMDFVNGKSLRMVLKEEGTLPLPRANHIFQQAADALSTAHQAGVVHRDLKPENIMLSNRQEPDHVHVVDFGISTLRQQHRVYDGGPVSDIVGSPPYMSPEQCRLSSDIDQRSDIYSFAVVLYEALSGKLPFPARSALEMLECHVSAQPVPLKHASQSLAACEALTALLARALEKKPEKRPESMEQFAQELHDAMRSDMISLNSLKHRRDLLNGSPDVTATHIKALDPETAAVVQKATGDTLVDPLLAVQKAQALSGAARRSGGFFESLTSLVSGDKKKPDPASPRYVFYNCPHCGESVERGISFCLSCGRTLAATQEFSKIRAAQGTFSLPRSQDISQSSLPAFDPNTRKRMTPHLNTAAICLIAVTAIAAAAGFVMAGGVDFVAGIVERLLSAAAGG